MLFRVQYREEYREDIVDILSRVTPNQVAERMDPDWRWQDPPPSGFDRLMRRACVAAVRLCGDPPKRPKGSSREKFEWEAKDYLRKLVRRRDEFAGRASKRLRVTANG